MNHPIFHVDETCNALVPTSTGMQLMECDITGPLTRRSVRDLDGNHLGYAMAYKVMIRGAVMECLFAERDLRKKWERCDWGMLKGIWQPKRVKR